MMTLPLRDMTGRGSVQRTTAICLAGKRVHFIGIGGCGMSGLARLARHLGARCSGSDLNETETVRLLQADGVPVVLEQSAETLPQDCELVVVSAAIKPDHPEMAAALRRGVQVKKYAELLGELMIGRTGVAIAGTHGKSTTTSLLSHILIRSGLDPSFIVGANCRQIGGGVRIGNSNILVAEACEYDRSFHNFHPTHAVILNVEADHLDIYRSLDEIVEAFKVFAGLLPSKDAGGSLLINHEMPHRLAITAELSCAVETLGFAPQADWRVGIEGGRVRLCRGDDAVIDWVCPMPGEHMAYNAAAAAISAHRLGADWADIAQAIESFDGLDRRMQWLGCKSSEGLADRNTPRDQVVTVVDDYGHHPTEIDTTLRALRHHYQPKRLICVFQPHQHSRTRFLMDEFAVSFSCADIVIVPHIYFVRDSEKERQAVTAGDLVDRLRGKGVQAMHLYPFDAIVEQLNMMTQPGDLVVTMGAGDVWQVAHAYLHADKTKDVR